MYDKLSIKNGETAPQSMMDGRDISDQNVTFIFFSKWVPTAILDVWNSFSFAFLTILNLNATFIFSQNGHRWPFWMSQINFCLNFWPFQIKTQLSFFLKMAAGSHFGRPKFIFVCISRHFRWKQSFCYFFQNGRQQPFWMSVIFMWLIQNFRFLIGVPMCINV